MGQGVSVVSQATPTPYGFQTRKVDRNLIILFGQTTPNRGYHRVQLWEVTSAGALVLRHTLDLAFIPEGSFGGAAVIGRMDQLQPYLFGYARGSPFSLHPFLGVIEVDPVAKTLTRLGAEVSPTAVVYPGSTSSASVSSTPFCLVGLGGQGGAAPGYDFRGTGLYFGQAFGAATPGVYLATYPPFGSSNIEVFQGQINDELDPPETIADTVWLQATPLHTDGRTAVVTIAYRQGAFDPTLSIAAQMSYGVLAIRKNLGYGYTWGTIHPLPGGAQVADLHLLADGRIMAVWFSGGSTYLRFYSLVEGFPSESNPPQLVVYDADIVIAAPTLSGQTGDPEGFGWGLSDDELTLLVPTRNPPFGFGGGHHRSGRRIYRFGTSWEFPVDDTVHPDLGLYLGSSGTATVIPMREDLSASGHPAAPGGADGARLFVLRAATVFEEVGGVVGMVPGSP